jgi:general secretion pathway protein C
MLARMSAFASWAVVAASLMYWGLRLFAAPATAPDYTVAVDQATRGDLARVFGASAAPAPAATVAAAPAPAAASRFKLVGVAAPRDAGTNFGLALISIDGKPARAVSVGRSVDEAWVLQSVSRQGVRLSSSAGAETMDLDIPPLALASRGVPGAVPSSAPPSIAPPGTIRPPVVIPPTGVPAPSTAPALVPGAQAAPGTPGGPPSIFVPQEELNRARSRAAGTGAAEE